MYDRISEPFRQLLDGLSATHSGKIFREMAAGGKFELHHGPRGSPENVGDGLENIHPVIRTNPVTGWKSVYGLGPFVQYINGVAREESDMLLKWFMDLIYQGHDLTVRLKWNNPNDLGKFCILTLSSYCHAPVLVIQMFNCLLDLSNLG